MNNAIIAAAASLAIGVGVGWSIKPSSPDSSGDQSNASTTNGGRAESNSSVPPGTAPAPIPSKSGRQPESAEASDMPWNAPQPGEGAGPFGGLAFRDVGPEELRKEQVKREESIKRDHEKQIANLARRLNLTPEQQDKLRSTHFAGLLEQDRFFNAPGEKTDGPPDVLSLGEALGLILTEEQAAAYDELRNKNMRAAARSEALEELAELSFLDLSKEQFDRLYDAMLEELQAEMAEDELEGEGAVLGAAGGAMLGAIIGNNVGDGRGAMIGAAIGGAAGYEIEGEAPDPAEVARLEEERARARQEATARMIEGKVADLQEYLTPQQVEEYRRHLEASYQDGPHFRNPPDLYLPPLER